MHKFLGAVDLWTLWGDKDEAVHMLSRKTAKIRLSLDYKISGIVDMYSSALEIALRVPISS